MHTNSRLIRLYVAASPFSRGKLCPNLSLAGCICSSLEVCQESVEAAVPRVARKKPKGRRQAPFDKQPCLQPDRAAFAAMHSRISSNPGSRVWGQRVSATVEANASRPPRPTPHLNDQKAYIVTQSFRFKSAPLSNRGKVNANLHYSMQKIK